MNSNSLDDLPDATHVVRAGLLKVDDLLVATEISRARFGNYSLSIFTVPDSSPSEIAEIANRPHTYYRSTTLGALRTAGIRIENWDRSTGHASIVFADRPTRQELRRLVSLFDSPELNPARREGRED